MRIDAVMILENMIVMYARTGTRWRCGAHANRLRNGLARRARTACSRRPKERERSVDREEVRIDSAVRERRVCVHLRGIAQPERVRRARASEFECGQAQERRERELDGASTKAGYSPALSSGARRLQQRASASAW
jgi:hypothetical protein